MVLVMLFVTSKVANVYLCVFASGMHLYPLLLASFCGVQSAALQCYKCVLYLPVCLCMCLEAMLLATLMSSRCCGLVPAHKITVPPL